MGPLREVFGKMPLFGGLADQVDVGELGKVEAMICSMTRQERSKPDVIDKSRAARIAKGSGRRSKDVTDLVKRFKQMREMMGNMGKPGGLLSKLGGGLGGGGLSPAGMDPSAMMAGLGDGGGRPGPMRSSKTKARNKNKRKQARQSRRKGRKR